MKKQDHTGDHILAEVEVRGNELHGVIIHEGRAADHLTEVFSVNALQWPNTGILIKPSHGKDQGAVTAFPWRAADAIKIRCNLSPELRSAYESGARQMSIEFHSQKETRTASGIRQIQSALLTAAALTSDPVYTDTQAEIRDKDGYRDLDWWL